LKDRLHAHTFQHLHGDSLMRFFKQVNELGVEQMQEDAEAAASVPQVDLDEALRVSEQPELSEGQE
jgi:hypothetical protein